MKTIKYLFLLFIIIFLTYLVYENQDFFMEKTSLTMNLKYKELVIPEIQNLAYFGVILFLGLFTVSVSAFVQRCRLKKQIKDRDTKIESLSSHIKELEIELDFFKSDPYIKSGLETIEKPDIEDDQAAQIKAEDIQENEQPQELETQKVETQTEEDSQGVETDTEKDTQVVETETEEDTQGVEIQADAPLETSTKEEPQELEKPA